MHDRSILIVDDEPLNLDALRHILEPEHPVMVARDGHAALAAVARQLPALVLLDIQMPGMSGYAACEALKRDPRTAHIPVIFVTALADARDEAHGFACGAVDYITKPFSAPLVRARVHTHLSLVHASQLERSHREAIFMLGRAGHYNDNDTGMHIWRMAAFAAELAAATGADPAEARELELAAPMHDTGKIGIPRAILCKPARLDAAEWETMKTHTRIGHDILRKSAAPVFQLAAQIALCHHERWDGSGYPEGLRGEQIPRAARIVAIADVFDALTMRRPYKPAWPLDQVVAALHEGAGSHFDPELLAVFLRILPRIRDIKAEWDAREASQADPGHYGEPA